MTRELLSFGVADVSSLAKSLKKELEGNPNPSHLEIMNMLARGAGFQNFQHFRAGQVNLEPSMAAEILPQDDEIENTKSELKKVTKFFDKNLVVTKWPIKESSRKILLWYFWSRIPYEITFNEISISRLLDALHSFGDAAVIRRYLVSYGFMERSKDGAKYKRLELDIPKEYKEVIEIKPSDIIIRKKRTYADYING